MLVDYVLTVIPLLLGVTVLAQRPWTLLCLLAAGTAALSFSREKPTVKGERDEGRRRRELREDDTSDEEDREDEDLLSAEQPSIPTGHDKTPTDSKPLAGDVLSSQARVQT